MEQPYSISSFYRFQPLPIEELEALRAATLLRAQQLNALGLFLIAPDGINATVSAEPEAMQEFEAWIRERYSAPDLIIKHSSAEKQPFRRLSVQVRSQIVTVDPAIVTVDDYSQKEGVSGIDLKVLPTPDSSYLSPQEWKVMLESEQPKTLLDTRNWYEVAVGTFEGAIDPKLQVFGQFREYVQKADLPKDQPVMMFCTGGIRCERAAQVMHEEGFKEVYQLHGGILNYIEQLPEQGFKGECFVFDHRVAVDQHLQPTTHFKLCPHCGNPGDLPIECQKCGEESVICKSCQGIAGRVSCSKNCAHHLLR